MQLSAAEVTKRYGAVAALHGASLDVAAGECVALVGESGSGKTTLLRCFNRMVDPDGGRVTVGGRDARELDPVALRRATGYVPQDGGLLPHWTVLRNAALVPRLRGGAEAAEADALAADAMRLAGLDPGRFAARFPHELSGGQRQRVALARALAGRPSVVLLDEPFGALDAITRADVQRTFLDVRRARPTACVLVTHDLREAEALADRVAVMRDGRVEQAAPAGELRKHPATEYVARLLQRTQL
jgi:osmoprotectant transport system ATP-binding protein